MMSTNVSCPAHETEYFLILENGESILWTIYNWSISVIKLLKFVSLSFVFLLQMSITLAGDLKACEIAKQLTLVKLVLEQQELTNSERHLRENSSQYFTEWSKFLRMQIAQPKLVGCKFVEEVKGNRAMFQWLFFLFISPAVPCPYMDNRCARGWGSTLNNGKNTTHTLCWMWTNRWMWVTVKLSTWSDRIRHRLSESSTQFLFSFKVPEEFFQTSHSFLSESFWLNSRALSSLRKFSVLFFNFFSGDRWSSAQKSRLIAPGQFIVL